MRWLLVLLLLAGIPACGRWERAGECRGVMRMVNGALDQMEQRQREGPPTFESYNDIAQRYEQLARDLGQFKVKDAGVAGTITEYQAFVQSAAQSTTKAAFALRVDNEAALTEARAELTAQAQRQKALNRQLEQACLAP